MTEKKILVFGGEKNPWHDFDVLGPIVAGVAAECGFQSVLTRDNDCFLPENIKLFDLIVVMASSGILTPAQEEGLLTAVIGQPGGDTGAAKGLLGVHGATVLSSESGRYQRMLGARFLSHPEMGPTLPIIVVEPEHPIMRGISGFDIVDELYLMETLSPFDTLLSTEFNGFKRPLAWIKPFGLGRVFYCALGHSEDQLTDANVRKTIANAMVWLAK